MAIQNIARGCFALGCLFLAFTTPITAQTEPPAETLLAGPAKGLFDTEEPLLITLRGPMRKLLNNRLNDPKAYPLVLSYTREDSSPWTMPVDVRTRGHFRRQQGNCVYPPLLIQFTTPDSNPSSVFRGQRKLKLVMPCAEDDTYIIREWLVYKIYNLITPQSFRARLVQVQMEDAQSKKPAGLFYGVLLEEEEQLASRNQMQGVERQMEASRTQREAFLKMAVFEYLIGNTDWSVKFLHNIKLMATDPIAVPVAVPYDFDHAGIVNAPYALPAEQMQLRSVRERRYRGFCVSDIRSFEPVIAQYNHLKEDLYRLYTGCTLLDEKYIQFTVRYLDEFYATINNPKAWQREFSYPCDPSGTRNVVIKGLKKD